VTFDDGAQAITYLKGTIGDKTSILTNLSESMTPAARNHNVNS
jgi:hypothetical protein